MKRDTAIALLICLGVVMYAALPFHQEAFGSALSWWKRLAVYTETNWAPNQRGLNVVVIGSDGLFRDARVFDTYLIGDGAFARYIGDLAPGDWVVVTARDEATTSLTEADLAALEAVGGTRSLAGRRHHAYILVGRAEAEPGTGLELLDPRGLDLVLKPGRVVAGRSFPVELRIRSAGFYGGDYASVRPASYDYTRVWSWVLTALRRA